MQVAKPSPKPVLPPPSSPSAPVAVARPADPIELDPPGLGELRLIARDPYTLFVQWDFPESELNRARAQAAGGLLVLRVHRRSVEGPVVVEIPVLGGERHEFVPVPHAGTPYACQLGYRSVAGGQWFSLGQSETVVTAPDPLAHRPGSTPQRMGRWISDDDSGPVQATRPMPGPAQVASATVPAPTVPVARADSSLRDEAASPVSGVAGLPVVVRTLAESPSLPSSAEMVQPAGAPWSPGMVPSAAVPMLEFSPSSPVVLPPEVRKGFWFAVNAEVVIYGSTEPDAVVTLAGRVLKLRPDGSFSIRFSLPDGQFLLPITASSADGMERRAAELLLARATGLTGDVGVHPQDKSLRSPAA